MTVLDTYIRTAEWCSECVKIWTEVCRSGSPELTKYVSGPKSEAIAFRLNVNIYIYIYSAGSKYRRELDTNLERQFRRGGIFL